MMASLPGATAARERPRLLDLFCGAGGAAAGYARAGWDVLGVDLKKQPRYPFPFVQADALEFLAGRHWPGASLYAMFDAIHASPPCQAYSVTKNAHRKQHPELLEPTRDLLERRGMPYVIENVPGAPMPNRFVLCGASFGLEAEDLDGRLLVLRRHRQFESNVGFLVPPCACADYRRRGYSIGGVYGGGSTSHVFAREVRHGGYTPSKPVQERLMGIDWMSRDELAQAIPPAYTEMLGRQLLAMVAQSPEEAI